MNTVRFKPLRCLLFIAAVGMAAVCGCDQATPEAATGTDQRPVIVATIFPLFSIVQQLSGEWAQVELLMPPGSSPHDFEPQPAQLTPLSRAKALVAVGLGLDTWGEQAARKLGSGELRIFCMSELGPGAATTRAALAIAPNQHLWMDPDGTARFVESLARALGDQFPEHRAALATRGASLAAELRALDAELRSRLATVPVKEMIAYHNAYDLLAERYGLRVVAHLTEIELAPGGEVTPRDLVQAIDAVQRYHLNVIYAEPQFPPRAAEMLRQQTGVRVLSLDDLGGAAIPGHETYQAMLRSDVQTLVEGQSLRGGSK